MKKKIKAMYFYAYWDGNYGGVEKFIETCKAYKIPFEVIDCETETGVKLSCKYGVKLCPLILFVRGEKEVGRAMGSKAYLEIHNYC